jgi:hypothetical protein
MPWADHGRGARASICTLEQMGKNGLTVPRTQGVARRTRSRRRPGRRRRPRSRCPCPAAARRPPPTAAGRSQPPRPTLPWRGRTDALRTSPSAAAPIARLTVTRAPAPGTRFRLDCYIWALASCWPHEEVNSTCRHSVLGSNAPRRKSVSPAGSTRTKRNLLRVTPAHSRYFVLQPVGGTARSTKYVDFMRPAPAVSYTFTSPAGGRGPRTYTHRTILYLVVCCCYGTRSPLQDLTRIIDFTFRFPMPH